MKILLLLALVALANADVSQFSGYKYDNPAPQSSYGAPQASVVGQSSFSGSAPSVNFVQYSQQPSNAGYQFSSQYSQSVGSGPSNGLSLPNGNGASLNSFNVGAGSSQGSSGFGFGGANGGNQGQASFGQSSSGSNGAAFDFGASQGSSGFGSSGNADADFGQSNGAASFNFGAQQSSGFGSGGVSAYQGQTSGGSIDESFGVVTNSAGGASASAAADVSKHLYFFSAPEEEDEVIQAKYDLPAVPAKKTYKIIFIKAPSYKSQGTITVPAPPQNEEKTLVYVLVKKPEGQPKVHFKEAAPTQPSKPEVFFIKYKTQKEAENAVAEIQSKHGASGQVIANLPAGTQAAFQSPDGSIVHNPSSVDIGSLNGVGSSSGGGYGDSASGASSSSASGYSASVGGASSSSGGYGGGASTSSGGYGSGASSSSGGFVGSVSGASSSSGGFSSDSSGANSFIGSRISEQAGQVSEQSSEGDVNVQVTGQAGAVSQSLTPVSFGQSSVDSSNSFSGGIAVAVSGSNGGSGESAQQETSEGDEYTTVESASASQDCCSGKVDQRVGGSDNEVQGSNSAVSGFSEYGVPKNRRFARRNRY